MDLQRISTLFEQRREGHTLPQALYTESDSFDFDTAAIYGQSWLMAVVLSLKLSAALITT